MCVFPFAEASRNAALAAALPGAGEVLSDGALALEDELPKKPLPFFLSARLPTTFLSETDTTVVNCFTSTGALHVTLPSYDPKVPAKKLHANFVENLRLQACMERVRTHVL